MFSKETLRQVKPENLRRLARMLKVRDLDQMSDRQVVRFMRWLLTRAEKRRRGLATQDW